jgi:hypothetical protein
MTMTLLQSVCLLAIVVGGQQPRERARPLTGTASLSGTVVADEPNGPPIARATMTLWIPGDSLSRRDTSTDENGRFAFTNLPAGSYTLMAAKAAYVTTYYGAKRPGSTVGVPIALGDGQRAAPVTLRILRGGVITGTIADEAGRPLPGVVARLSRVTMSANGTRTYATSSVGSFIRTSTDDRGVYRIFGLPPGEYVVSARPPMPGDRPLGAPTGGSEVRPTTAAELQWAERQIAGATGPAAQAASPPAPAAPVTDATVYHPNVVDAAAASVVSIAAGQERAGIDIRVRHVTTARIEGTVTAPDGQTPTGVQIMLIPKNDGAVNDIDIARAQSLINVGLMASPGSARINPDGTFAMQGVEPGGYWLTARTTARPAPVAGAAAPPLLWASVDLDVDGRDIRGLAVALAPAVTIAGRVVFAGAPAAPPGSRVTFLLSPMHPASVAVNTIMTPDADGAFVVNGVVPGRYRLNATSGAWSLQSAAIGARDVTDGMFDVPPGGDITNVAITLTNAPASLGGTLFDAANRPSSDLSVILFATNRAVWFSGSRRLRQPVRPDSNGRFAFTAIPAGDYYLAALTDFEQYDWFNPAFLEQVAAMAIKVTIAEGEKKVQDLKVAGGGGE